MGTARRHYSHAAPYIREALVQVLAGVEGSRTQRDRRKRLAEAFGYGQALTILRGSDDYEWVEGLPDVSALPRAGIEQTLSFLGEDNVAKLFGAQTLVEMREAITRKCTFRDCEFRGLRDEVATHREQLHERQGDEDEGRMAADAYRSTLTNHD